MKMFQKKVIEELKDESFDGSEEHFSNNQGQLMVGFTNQQFK